MGALFIMVLRLCIQKVSDSSTFRDLTGIGGHLLLEAGYRNGGHPPLMTQREHPFTCLWGTPCYAPGLGTAGTDAVCVWWGGNPEGAGNP